ncbi:MAG: hypothetical protein CHACPFDD_00096 [Phycisphaerae bacterium]|nr:hypothetical protein [Phycisphaerae bacterium]
MKAYRCSWGLLSGVVLLAVTTGCGPDAKQMQIDAQQDRIAELERQKGDLEQRLASSMRDADQARASLAELRRQLDEAQRQLAARPELPEGWQGRGAYAWTNLSEDILFDSGKNALKGEGARLVAETARTIQSRFADMDVWVIGHTDTDPIKHSAKLWKDNLDLSQGRAHTVAHELMKLGLEPRTIIAGGQGEFAPLADNASKEGKSRNRRVQIVVVPPLNSAPAPAERAAGGEPQ